MVFNYISIKLFKKEKKLKFKNQKLKNLIKKKKLRFPKFYLYGIFISHFFFLLFKFHIIKTCLSPRYIHSCPVLVQSRPSPPGFLRNCYKHQSAYNCPYLSLTEKTQCFIFLANRSQVFLVSSARLNLPPVTKLISNRNRIQTYFSWLRCPYVSIIP